MQRFPEALDERVLVCDGAMGTMLYAKGVFINKSFDALNVTQPDLVAEVHQEYVRAGADIVETNTFGANRIKLASFGIADKLHAINEQGARIARHAADGKAYVAGAIGPLGIRIEPWGKTGVDEAREYFREQAQALADGGVDLFILETFRDLNEIGAAIDAVRSVSDGPIVAQMTTEEDGNTLDGTPPERFAPDLERRGATILGVNCAVGPAPMLDTIERMEAVTRLRLSAQPNAGKPRDVEGRNIYLCSPEYMASYARRFILHNVRIVGGCCGTTPEHIRQIKTAVRGLAPSVVRGGPGEREAARASSGAARSAIASGLTVPVQGTAPPIGREQKSRLAHAMARGTFVVAVELLPPRGFQIDQIVERARRLRIRGVDAVNVPDGLRAGARISALSLAVLIEQQAGIETVLHYACRDRNLLGIQSDLLGAHAMGLRNLLLITGDPGRVGDYPDATAVFDVDSIGLTNVVSRLNHGCDVGGQAIGAPTAFHVGVSVNPGASNLDQELRRLDYKVEAGAEFVMTRPVFDVRAFEAFLKRIEPARLPVVAGVFPFESVRNAEFMANEVPGVRVPDALIERMRRAELPEAASAEGIAIAREITAELRGAVQGVQVSTQSGDVDAALAVIDGLR
ncbi:MAG TPA: bifunctional homocysteine S-methyltransferase/methylenetetrahydrofolate reductase [Vicinamibacterales bacterium]|jgi:homocysteine S-methyltransferase|nr:bifunctional homocysteine S-methyltransferase/methylenetetrahydrofolate reductase [Vicinamibacterales bacterium]